MARLLKNLRRDNQSMRKLSHVAVQRIVRDLVPPPPDDMMCTPHISPELDAE